MRRLLGLGSKAAGLSLLCLFCTSGIRAQQPSLEVSPRFTLASASVEDLVAAEPPVMRPQPAEIIERFIATEASFRESFRNYTFMRDVVLQTIGAAGEVTGEYIRNSQFVLDDRGGRVERVLFHPKSTIKEMKITKEDIQDLAGAQLFGFEFSDVSRYNIAYAGLETIDLRETYAIDVRPKQAANPMRMSERFFIGRIWVDSRSFQIIRLRGVAVPQGKQRFPTFETVRAKSDVSETLFPSSTLADEILRFPARDVHYRVVVKYHSYKRFASKVTIVEIDQPASELQ